MCHNISMKKNASVSARVIEPEVLDEHGNPIATPTPRYSQSTYRGAGFLTGFVALAVSVMVGLVGVVLMCLFVVPLLLIGRILGLQIKRFYR